MDGLCQVWLKLALTQVKNTYKCRQCDFSFRYDLLLEKGAAFHVNELEFPSP